MLKNLRNKNKGFTLVELMIVVAIIGILAAIAIPAFIKYIKRSKASEAPGVVKKMQDGAKAYFESDQVNYGATPGDGASEPWHTGDEGTIVRFEDKTFPGGGVAGNDFISMTLTPYGGAKDDNFLTLTEGQLATSNKLNFEVSSPMYFAYGYGSTGTGATSAMTAWGCHSFNGTAGVGTETCIDGAATGAHTFQAKCSVQSTTKGAKCFNGITYNEFE